MDFESIGRVWRRKVSTRTSVTSGGVEIVAPTSGSAGSETMAISTPRSPHGLRRALEVMLSGEEDYDADLTQQYGWVNRAVPVSGIDTFVLAPAHGPKTSSISRRSIAAAQMSA